jgi:hypothetical protein
MNLIHIGSSYIGFKELPAGTAMALFYTYPFFNIIAGLLFLGENFKIATLPFFVLAIGGVYLLSKEKEKPEKKEGFSKTNWTRGLIAIFIAALTETLIFIIAKVAPGSSNAFYPMLQLYVGAFFLWIGVLGAKAQMPDWSATGPLVLFNIFIGFLGYAMRFYAIPLLPTAVFSILSFIGVIIAKWKKIKFVYWVMDLQPELSISSGLIKKDSLTARLFTYLGNYIIKNSNKVISLDRFMTNYLLSRGAKNNISTIPVWPVIDEVYQGNRTLNPFRLENDFGERIVIMYSGNHAYVHPLDTLLETALRLKDNLNFLFVFVGGGVRKKDVTEFKNKFQLNNIVQLPYQPRENIHNSLGSSDIQVVILGDGQVGYTHPNKVYGALYIGKSILYIGPKESHVGDILDELNRNIHVEHGEVDRLVNELNQFAESKMDVLEKIGIENKKYAELNFDPDVLKNKMVEAVVN